MQQVADWLEKLGLGQYAQRVAERRQLFRTTRSYGSGPQGHGACIIMGHG
jgi:hypothetical protein